MVVTKSIRQAIEYLPLFTASLILIGFLNYASYYRFFDLEILHYLTSGELLLSFLPLALPILIVFMIIVIIIVLDISLPGNSTKDKEPDENEEGFWSLTLASDSWRDLKNHFKGRDRVTLKKAVHILFALIALIWGAGVVVFFVVAPFIIFPLAFESKIFPDWDHSNTLLMSFIWFILSFGTIQKLKKKREIKNTYWLEAAIIIIGFIFFTSLSNKMVATEILQGKPKLNIEFQLEGKTVSTDTNTVYIGRTSQYIFLRNLREKTTLVLQANDLKEIKFTKIILSEIEEEL